MRNVVMKNLERTITSLLAENIKKRKHNLREIFDESFL